MGAIRPAATAGRIVMSLSLAALLGATSLTIGPVSRARAATPEVDEPAITDIVLDGALRSGEGFVQILRADVAGDVPAGSVVVVEPIAAANPGTIRVSRLEVADDGRITGIVRQASAPGTYLLTMCLVPKPTATCSSALASRVFSIDVAGPPAELRLDPREDTVDAGVSTSVAIAVLDSTGARTQLSLEESLELDARADRGSVGVEGLPEAIDRIRDGLRASIEVTVVWPDDRASLTLTSIGVDVPPQVATLRTRSLTDPVAVVPQAQVILVASGRTAGVRGRVVDSSGAGIAGVTVNGVVTGATTTATSTDVTGSSGGFRLDYTSSDAPTGSRDSVTISADAGPLGIATATVSVVLSANGRTPIRDLRFDGIPVDAVRDPTPVVYDGYAISGVDAERITVQAEVPGAPVVMRTATGWLTDRDGAAWNDGRRQVTVTSDPVSGIATAFLFTTLPGDVDVTAVGAETLSGEAVFRTRPAAARSLRITASTTRMRTGQRVRLVTTVTDVFGTPVPEAAVDLAISGVGAFDAGTRRLTLTTDAGGRIALYASAPVAGLMTITATGRAAQCVRGENQYLCGRDEPGPGFAPASGPASTQVTVTAFRPTVRVVAPAKNLRVSYNEWVRVRATSTDIRPGTRAQLRSGSRVLTSAKVSASGRIEFPPVHAQGRGTFTVTVGGVRDDAQVTVMDFSITSVRRSQGSMTIGVATGAWKPSTRIMLTRNGTVVATQRVVARGRPMTFIAPQRSGTYQVRVASRIGPVTGRAARFIP